MKKAMKHENLRRLIRQKIAVLENGEKTMETVYRGMFDRPDAVACETDDGYTVEQTTYAALAARIDSFASALAKRIGGDPGYVALAMDNSPAFLAAFWGTLHAGAKPYLINLRHPQALQVQLLQMLDIHYLISEKKGSLPGEYLLFDELQSAEAPPAGFADAFALSTSATGGKAVACEYTGAAVIEQLLDARGILKKSRRAKQHAHGALKQLAFLPFYHVFGLFAVYFWFAYFSRTMVFVRDLSPQTLLGTARLHHVTHIFAVPMLWHETERQLLRTLAEKPEKEQKRFWRAHAFCLRLQQLFPYAGAAFARRLLHAVTDELFGRDVRFCISGGSYLRPSALRLFNGLGYPLHNGYGMTETGITSVELAVRPKRRLAGSVGAPFDSVRYVQNEDGTLTVCGTALCSRILRQGEEIFPQGKIRTDDLVCHDGKGWFVRGRRADTVIGENGENIDPDLCERAFSLPDAAALCVLGLGPIEQQTLSLVIEVSPYLSARRLKALGDYVDAVNETLPLPQRARAVYYTVDPILHPGAIKVSRRALREAIEKGTVHLSRFSALPPEAAETSFDETSALCRRVRSILAQVFRTEEEKITPHASFFADLGVSSLAYFAALSAVAKDFSLPSTDGAQGISTLQGLCEYLEAHL